MPSKPHPVDIYIGKRLRRLRMERQISQEKLGEKLGITFQQIQKYEKGANRLSASKLTEAAVHLNVKPAYFFEGVEEVVGDIEDIDTIDYGALLDTGSNMRLLTAFDRISGAAIKQSLVVLVEQIATEHPKDN